MLPSKIVGICLALVCSLSLSAQRHYFVSFSVKEGLAQSQVRDILQTQDGYLWIATVGGISRFDGNSFVTYNRANGLPNNLTSALYEPRPNELWAACKGGLVKFQGNNVTSLSFNEPFDEVISNDMTGFEGSIYLASNGRGLLELINDSIRQIDIGDRNKNFIRTIAATDSKLYIGTKDGLFTLQEGKIDTLIANISVSSIFTESNAVWLTTYGDGIYEIRGEKTSKYTTEDGFRSNSQRKITLDKNGLPWVVYKNGIDRFHPETGEVEIIKSFDPALTSNLKTVYKDLESNIWIGTDGLGILKYTGDQFSTYTIEDGLSSEIIMDVEQLPNGDHFFATYGSGVIRFNQSSNTFSTISNGLKNLTVWSILIDDSNSVYFGTSSGVSVLSDNQITDFELNDDLPWPRVSQMFQDTRGIIWFGTREGIMLSRNGKKIDIPGVTDGNIRESKSFTEANGKVWIASNRGLYSWSWRDSILVHHNKENTALKEESIFCLTHDKFGNIWLGSENGIICYNPKNEAVKNVLLSTQVSSNIINFLLNENDERLWAGTDHGLFSLDLNLFNEGDSSAIKSYTEHDGVIGAECNQNAAFRDQNGSLWFGTNGGLVKYDPNAEPSLTGSIQKIHISQVLSNFEDVTTQVLKDSSQGPHSFSSGENRLSFRYSAIHHKNPTKILYSFKLEGSDNDWSPASKENYVTYANLSPGSYEFKVRSKIDSGQWSSNIARFKFEIQAPFWRQWWFILLVLLVLSGILYLINIQVKKEKQRKEQIEDIQNRARILGLEQQTLNAHMNRHFIFNALNSIQYYINTQDRKMANMYLSNFATLVRKNLDSAQVEKVLLKEELERLKLYMNLEQMRFSNRFDFNIDVDHSVDIEHTLVPSMILQPFVENSIMHGILPLERKGQITISIRNVEDDLKFELKDDGIGIDKSMMKKAEQTSHHVSNGMKITKQRMDLLKRISKKNYSVEGPNQLTDENGNSKGTLVVITLPIELKIENF